MKKFYNTNEVPSNCGMLEHLTNEQVFTDELVAESLVGFGFNEFTLEELGLPPAEELLKAVLAVKDEVGIVGWKTKEKENKVYRGFSLTYNPDYYDSITSIHHQTWGSDLLTQNFGRIEGVGDHTFIKNTYYDTYAFRKIPPSVKTHLGSFLDKFTFPVFRSRVAFYNMYLKKPNISGWHIDEMPTHMFRINIPLQTSEEHILEIKGSDEFGNSLDLVKHLEVGKAYIWNTRIPHKVDITKVVWNPKDRIHLVIGLSPWIEYNPETDLYSKSKFYGTSMVDIIKNKSFIKKNI